MKSSDFYTVPLSEQGVKAPLIKPDGTDSGEWLVIYGPDAEASALADEIMNRRLGEVGKMTIEEIVVFSREQLLINRAAKIKAWSFVDEPFSQAAVIEFLRKAPVIADHVARFNADRKRFLGPGSTSSTDGQPSSDASAAEAGQPQNAASESR